jgi:hypothetical protein
MNCNCSNPFPFNCTGASENVSSAECVPGKQKYVMTFRGVSSSKSHAEGKWPERENDFLSLAECKKAQNAYHCNPIITTHSNKN